MIGLRKTHRSAGFGILLLLFAGMMLSVGIPGTEAARRYSGGFCLQAEQRVIENRKPNVTAQDREILSTLVKYVVSHPEVITRPLAGDEIVLDEQTLAFGKGDPAKYFVRALSKDGILLPDGIVEDLKTRNKVALSVREFKVRDQRLLVTRLDKLDFGYGKRYSFFEDAFVGRFPKARGYMCVSRPGYSTDGQQALVGLITGPNIYSGTAACLFVREKGKWVVSRYEEFVTYTGVPFANR